MLDKKVRFFLKVADTGSFSAAARALYITQPALSKQMTRLEEEIGVRLFDRSGYRAELTEEGKIFYQECVKLERKCQSVIRQLHERAGSTIRVGFTGSFENREILTLLNHFKQKEQVSVTFVKNSFEECLTDLLDDRVDVSFGIESTYKFSSEIEYEFLHSYEMCVITSFDHPLAKRKEIDVKEIRNENLICLSRKFGKGFYRDFMESFERDRISPNVRKEVDTLDELIFNVSVGEGIAIVSKNVVREEEVRILDLKNSHHSSNYVIAYKKELKNLEIQKLIQETLSYFHSIT